MSSPKLCDVSSKYGAPMGRNGCRPLDFNAPLKFYLRRVPLNSGGYDSGGAYWGHGSPLYYACSVDEVRPHNPYGPPGELRQVELFARAYDRDDAKAIVRQECPHATFFN